MSQYLHDISDPNKSPITSASLSLFHIAKAFGLTCLSKGAHSFTESRIGALYNGVILIVVFTLGVVASVVMVLINLEFMNSMSTALSLANLWAPMFLTLSAVYGARDQKAVLGCLEDMDQVDKALKDVHVQVPHVENQRFIARVTAKSIALLLAFIVCDVLLLVFNDALQTIYENKGAACVILALSVQVPRMANTVFGCKLMVWLLGIKQRFHLLNNHLDSITGKRLAEVKKLSEIHASLCLVARKANDIHSFALLTAVSSYFVNVLIIVYSGAMILSFREMYEGMDFLTVYVVYWLVWYVGTLLVVCKCCGEVGDEARSTGVLVHRAMGRTTDKDTKMRLSMFSNQLMHDKVDITACQFFDINLKLVASMATAVATYLIILVQLQIVDEKNKSLRAIFGQSADNGWTTDVLDNSWTTDMTFQEVQRNESITEFEDRSLTSYGI